MGNTFKVINLKGVIRLLFSVSIPLAIGGLASLFTRNSQAFYAALQKPPLAPPGFVFPIIWTGLYILIGIAAYLIARRGLDKDYIRDALYFYGASLLLSLVWPIAFFRWKLLFGSFWIILLLWLIAGIATAKFYRIHHTAGFLLLPYWLWISFAGYLNLAFWLLNR